jgi:hypothetical protein
VDEGRPRAEAGDRVVKVGLRHGSLLLAEPRPARMPAGDGSLSLALPRSGSAGMISARQTASTPYHRA